MNRKNRIAIEREAQKLGAKVIEWDHGQKHEIACIQIDGGKIIEVPFSRGARDDVLTKRFLRRRISEAA